ncbi:MAG: NADH-dependent flavin oxidoreductase [Bacteroidetes bacterium]|nr:NADH-dependent flavin oxidoreductase [Bacteroidota bacterium]
MQYPRLFEEFRFRSGLSLRNRIVMAPMTTWSSHDDGKIHPDELAYLRRRASGPGMVITAAAYVHPLGHAFPGQWSCHDDVMLPSLRSAAEVIHEQGARAVLQIHHGGRMCPESLLGNRPVSASAEPATRAGADIPRPMTTEEITQTIAAFAAATRRALEAGYDGVEIHGANTYLLQQFFSPHSNRRTDEWGGSLEHRMRFPLAVMEAVLAAAENADRPFAVGYRISPEEIENPGITIEDTLEFVEVLARYPIDWLHVSVRSYFAGSLRDDSDPVPPTRRIIKTLHGRLPVIGVGLVYSPQEATAILDDGCAAVALGRILLMEPEWVEKVRDGSAGTIHHALPATDGDAQLTIPSPMYRMLLNRSGWLPLE